MNHILTARLRLSVPDLGNLKGLKFVQEIDLKYRRPASDAERSSALTDYGCTKHGHLPLVVSLREPTEYLGFVRMTINLDAFTMDFVEGKAHIEQGRPLEAGMHVEILHRFRGRGYGLEAATAFYEYVTGVLGAARVVSEARCAEPQAVKLMRGLGMDLHPEPTPEYPHRIVGIIESATNPAPKGSE
jgi:RimJ/RimL family protein N-acetyltransferase